MRKMNWGNMMVASIPRKIISLPRNRYLARANPLSRLVKRISRVTAEATSRLLR